MAKITQMLIHNIELEEGAWGEYWVVGVTMSTQKRARN